MEPSAESLLVVGASARSAAFSASRAGYRPVAIDLFGDVDLAECCKVEIWDYQTETLLRVAKRLPACAWLYTGALENWPGMVRSLALQRPLYGNSFQVLSAVRDPWRLAAALRKHGCRVAKLSNSQRGAIPGNWVKKPLRSAGGNGVARVVGHHSVTSDRQPSYLQEYIHGPSYGAVYTATADCTILLGITRQLIGAAWTGANGLRYCGSIGPVDLCNSQQHEFRRLGDAVAAEFDLRGLFGIDVVVNTEGVWTLEVNPRYTASVELLERARDMAAIKYHVAACEGRTISDPSSTSDQGCFGKAILFAKRRVRILDNFTKLVSSFNAGQSWPAIADIPSPGAIIEKGRPVTTVFAEAATIDLVEILLRQRAQLVQDVVGC